MHDLSDLYEPNPTRPATRRTLALAAAADETQLFELPAQLAVQWISANHSPTAFRVDGVELISPAQSGKSSAELETHFRDDMRSCPEEEEIVAGHPVFAADLHFEGRFDNLEGLNLVGDSLHGCVLARGIDSGQILGMVRFKMWLSPPSALLEFERELITPRQARELHLTIDFDLIYVCRDYRGEGVSRQLIEFVADIFHAALASVGKQLQPVAERHDARYRLITSLDTECVSWTGKDAAECMLDALDDRCQRHRDVDRYPRLVVINPDWTDYS